MSVVAISLMLMGILNYYIGLPVDASLYFIGSLICIVGLCADVTLKAAPIKRASPQPDRARAFNVKPPQRNTAGYVYLMGIETGLYKVGLSSNAEGRRAGLSTGLPYKIELIHKVKCRNCYRVEQFFHEKFAAKRVRGEWFNLDPDDIEYFKVFTEV